MAQSLVKTFATFGLEGHEITIEADINKALPTIEIIGLPDAAIKESKERLRSTFRNLAIAFPPHKIILNLAPSDVKKAGTQFDLPMAVAVLFLISGHIHHKELLNNALFFGELGLDGSVRKINGALPAVISAQKKGYKTFFVPEENVHELSYVQGITLYSLTSFREVVDFFILGRDMEKCASQRLIYEGSEERFPVDFSAIKGHAIAKRALTIAAAGGHNVLLIGAPGSGKTLLSHALPSIMPPLKFDEMIDASQIYSLVGKLTDENPLVSQRPFRSVHHTASKVSIVGGGTNLLPGEISLAHKGILFFDEIPEFPREVIEVLRQPLEDKKITISRAAGSVSYPAHFMFVASMNPCNCGYYKDPERPCICGLGEISRYQSKISGPLLDRIDIILEIPREKTEVLFDRSEALNSKTLRSSVLRARQTQQQRYIGTLIGSNAELKAKDLETYISLDEKTETFLKHAAEKLHLSGRVIHRLLKLSRTIADIEGAENIALEHVAEAMQYRSKNMFIEKQ